MSNILGGDNIKSGLIESISEATGIPVAAYIMENGLCLEEFTAELQAAIQDFLDRGGDPERVQAYLQTPSEDNP